MSFDLEVYGELSLSPSQIAEVISSTDGLAAEWDAEHSHIVALVQEESGRYCLTLDGPFVIEEEDIPAGWRSVLAGATALYEIHADAGNADAVHSALAFARNLATRVSGRIIDPQNEAPPDDLPPPRAADATQFLHLHWYRSRDGRTDLAAIFLRAARDVLPLAVPTRFGPHEPLQGKFPRDADAEFDRVYADECAFDRLWLTGKKPSIGGYLGGWASPKENWPVDLMMTFEYEGLKAAGAVDAVKQFFIAVARGIGSFSAYVELNDAAYSTSAPLRTLGKWAGLSDKPQWLTWYSDEYATIVHPFLTGGVSRTFPEGLLHQWTEAPATAEQIQPLLVRDPWAPPELFPLRSPSSRRDLLRAADTMPPSLRVPDTA